MQQPMATPTTHAPAAPQGTPMPPPFVPQTGSTGNFMMPGMTSGAMTSGAMGSMGSGMGGGCSAPAPTNAPPSLNVESLAAAGASFAGLDGATASLAANLAGQATTNFL